FLSRGSSFPGAERAAPSGVDFFELGRVPRRCWTAGPGFIGLEENFKRSSGLTTIPLGLHWLSREAILVVRRSTMRRSFAIAGLAGGSFLGCGPPFAVPQGKRP